MDKLAELPLSHLGAIGALVFLIVGASYVAIFKIVKVMIKK